jgi:hypothetical protein
MNTRIIIFLHHDRVKMLGWVIVLWMDLAHMLFMNNKALLFIRPQDLSLLLRISLWLFLTIPEKLAVPCHYRQAQMLCHLFCDCSGESSLAEHHIPF